MKESHGLVSRAQRSTQWCGADPGPFRSLTVLDQRCTARARTGSDRCDLSPLRLRCTASGRHAFSQCQKRNWA